MSTGEYGRGEEAGRLLAGRYRVLAQLGRGGMGVVWRAMDEVLGREVAVKELRTYTDAGGSELADLRVRMRREARAAARIKHPGVVAVHDVADEGGRPVIVMELIDGPSLDDVLTRHGVMDPREAARIGAKVMEALGAAHRAGVLHRDVKPGNVLLEAGGRVVLTDFGIAAMDDPGDGSSTHLTRSGELVGSLDYLAPERAQGQEPGPASDVWALGATLYAAVEGNSPFRRTSTWSTLTAIVVDPLPEARRAGPLGAVLQQLMHKDPALRPDAETAARLLAAVAGDSGAITAPIGLGEHGAAPAHAPRVPTEINPVPHRPEGFGPPPTAGPSAAPSGPSGPSGPSVTSVTSVTSRHRAVPADGPGGRRAKKSRMLVAAGVAAVLLAGGGVTYVLVDRGGSTAGENVAGDGPTEPDEGPDGRVLDPGAATSGDKSPSAKPKEQGDKASKPPKDDKKSPAPGGGTDDSDPDGKGKGDAEADTDGGRPGSGGESTGGGGGGTDPDPAPVCHPIGGGKYNCQVWRQANSYTADGAQAGVLNAGTNYFYCQRNLGRRETSGQWTNIWWAKTDDDNGNTNVFVSDVYISGGDNDQPLPGLPVC
ncbi:serine/threonine-protein kinase [Streptomyces sp. NBC_01716]|uniref:serine/threonine-protein kinase n=1 Tax=Streptomyces sp. NBC_01716 TaxID=2975917 RepID=UPI002E2F1D99|nr:serine/threonine-protein kinase [Streptomyces sp. NBC_01716]